MAIYLGREKISDGIEPRDTEPKKDSEKGISSGAVYDALSVLLPAGTVLDFAGVAVPDGFLPCDGSAVLIASYRNLYKALKNEEGVYVLIYPGNISSISFIPPENEDDKKITFFNLNV